MKKQNDFFIACRKGDVKRAERFLKSGGWVEARDKYNLTGLIYAAREGNYGIVELLVQYHADVDATDNTGRTAFFHSVCFGHVEVIELLSRLNSNINVVDMHGCTPLDIAFSNRDFDLVRTLESLGAKPKLYAADLERTKKELLEISVPLDQLKWNKNTIAHLVQPIKDRIHKIEIKQFSSEVTTVGVCLYMGGKDAGEIDHNREVKYIYVSISPEIDTQAHEEEQLKRIVKVLDESFDKLAGYLDDNYDEFDKSKFLEVVSQCIHAK